ncbi:retrovirus-related pol polyprotein from transposon TNT 1-94 [Tanacetum coccineum]
MLIFSKSPLFLWAKAVATACYTQNRSLIHIRYNKTPYEQLRDRKPELKYLHIFCALCYPTNYFEHLGKLYPKANIGIFIGYSPSKKAYWIYNKRTRQIMETMNVQFDEHTQMASEQHGSRLELHAEASSSSTSIDKDAPSPSTSLNIETASSPINSTNVEPNEEIVEFDSDTFTNPFTYLDTSSAESSSRIIDTSNMHTFQQPPIYTKRWTKDHSFTIIIGDPLKPVSTRFQLSTDALWCYFHTFLAKEEPKNYKEAKIESS